MSWFTKRPHDADESKAYEWAEYNVPGELAASRRAAPAATDTKPASDDDADAVSPGWGTTIVAAPGAKLSDAFGTSPQEIVRRRHR